MKKINKTLLIVLLIGILVSCSSDCPTCPQPAHSNALYKGRLYVSMILGDPPGFYVINTENDSIIYNVDYENSALNVDVAGNGKFFYVYDDKGITRVYDALSFGIVKQFSDISPIRFLGDGSTLLAVNATQYLEYSVPGFSLVGTFGGRTGSFGKRYQASTNWFFSVRDLAYLQAIDADSFKLAGEWTIMDYRDSVGYIWGFDVHPRLPILYAIVDFAFGGYRFVTYSLDTRKIINQYPLFYRLGDVRVRPDGEKVYVTDPAIFASAYDPGQIYVFDAESGNFEHSISLLGYIPQNEERLALDARRLEFTPDSKQLYVATGTGLTRAGTVLRIDTATDKVEKLIFPMIEKYPFTMAVGPKP